MLLYLLQCLYQLIGYLMGMVDYVVGLFGVALSYCNAQGFRVKMGTQGYGDLSIPLNAQDELLQNIQDKTYVKEHMRLDTKSMQWGKLFAFAGIRVFEATFASPARAILPPESHRGHFWYVQPLYRSSRVTVVVLPSTGEEHIVPRILLAWYWAFFHGYTSILLTAPLYGCRKPAEQNLFFINTMADMIGQLLALCQETVAVTAHTLQNDKDMRVVITGFSIGGGMSVFAAALAAVSGCDKTRLGVVPYVGATDPSCVVEGMFSALCDWQALIADSPVDEATLEQVQRKAVGILKNCIQNFDQLVQRLGPNEPCVQAATMVDMSHDQFFPSHAKKQLRQQVHAIAASVVETELPGGHIAGAVLRPFSHARAVVQTVQTMREMDQEDEGEKLKRY